MAEQKAKKTTRKPKADKPTATYNGQTYEVLDRNDRAVCLTDGTIHFWVEAQNVTD